MFTILTRPKVAAAAILLVFLLLLSAFATILAALWRGGGHATEMLLMTFLPIPFYLSAIWIARLAILRIGSGGALRTTVSTMLQRMGWALFAGGLVRTFAVPWGYRIVHGSGPFAAFDAAAITVGAIGVTLVIVARLIAEAEAIRAELDEFF